jgi:hypothetical protein
LTDLRRALVLGALAGTLVLSAACGGGGGDDDAPRDDDGSDEPGAADVENDIATLLARHDTVVDQILADPTVAEDPDDPLIAEYLDLYEPGNELPEAVIGVWQDLAAQGRHVEPFDDEHPLTATRLDGDIEVVSDSEVNFPYCSETRERVFEDDEPVEGTPLAEQAGAGVAVLADGDWVFRENNAFDDGTTCATSTITTSPSTTPTTTEGT